MITIIEVPQGYMFGDIAADTSDEYVIGHVHPYNI
jgi:hypothetical protein